MRCRCGSDDKIIFDKESKFMIRSVDKQPHICLGQEKQQTNSESTKSNDLSYEQLAHPEVWDFALNEATKIYPDEKDKTPGMILAQVFYKKNFDYRIHHNLIIS